MPNYAVVQRFFSIEGVLQIVHCDGVRHRLFRSVYMYGLETTIVIAVRIANTTIGNAELMKYAMGFGGE